jgi:glycosyltransferase involved in cell wall biosynthesis
MSQSTISLCMIVKNEEDQLPRCLKSVRSVVDEIVIVDTGSTDRTVEIARDFGAKVIEAEWTGDFAAARNLGLDQAQGDWILFLDADEELDLDDARKLREIARQREHDAFFLQIHNHLGAGEQGATINPILRMFQNRPEYRFEGRIHEQIASSICTKNPRFSFSLTDIKIHHYGYTREMVEKKNKMDRNIALLHQILQERPNDPFHLYNLGVEYLRRSNIPEALSLFRQSRLLVDGAPISYAHLLYKYEFRCLFALGRYEEGLELLQKGMELYPDYTDLHHLHGHCLAAIGRTNEAKQSLARALEKGPASSFYHTEEGMGTYQTCYVLGLLHEADEEYEQAIVAYLAAIRFKNSLTPPLFRIFRLLKCLGREEAIPAFIADSFQIKTAEARKKMIAILERTDCHAAASQLLAQMGATAKPDDQASTLLRCLLLRGDLKQARRLRSRLKHKKIRQPRRSASLLVCLDWLEHPDRPPSSREPLTHLLFGRPLSPADMRHLQAEDLATATRIAFANHKIHDAQRLLAEWNRAIEQELLTDSQHPIELSRTLSFMADRHLECLSQSVPNARAVRQSRFHLPVPDGFSEEDLRWNR